MRGGAALRIVGTIGAEVETFYEFAYSFCNVSGHPAASSVRAAPCQLPRRGSFCVSTNSPFVSAMFQAPPLTLISLGLCRASFPGGEAFVPGFGAAGLSFQNSYFKIHFFLDFLQNILTNASEIFGNIPIAVAQNCKAQII